ncbi:tyrosine-type recombinase/integrase [Mycobacteroides abscessus]|uniref:tyrosine-type recombinase/integrase n=1 Tax=Mycobacteroides abscessus TaxID=36809 RepID=UPI0009A5A345|nr:tyrosine-type recombinase/integrase [Mycobacteroides abscessus]
MRKRSGSSKQSKAELRIVTPSEHCENPNGTAGFGVRKAGMGREFYSLSEHWTLAICGWAAFLKLSGMAAETIRNRRGTIRSVARRLPAQSPREVTYDMLEQLCAEHDWSNDHRRTVRTVCIQFFDWCIKKGHTADNPAIDLPYVPESPPRPRPAPDHVLDETMFASDEREQMIAKLASQAGMRRSEIAVAHRDDLIEQSDGPAMVVHGKGGKQRIVPISPELAADIRRYRKRGYLFPGQIDGHLSPGHVGVLMSRAMPDTWTMHKLRHRYATLGYNATHDIRAVQLALGHASVATTQRYTAVAPEQVRAVSMGAKKRFSDTRPGGLHVV